MISHKYKCTFVHIPKTGGNSIKQALELRGEEHEYVSSLELPYFSFTFVRNPFDRFVSAYSYLKNGGINENDKRHGDELINKFESFEEFVKNGIPDQQHFKPMSHWIDGELDFIGRVERFQEDFNVICDKIGIPHQRLPHTNKSKHKPYTEYYNEATRQIVAEKYAKDVEYFGYEFGE